MIKSNLINIVMKDRSGNLTDKYSLHVKLIMFKANKMFKNP